MKKKDIILLFAIITVALLCLFFFSMFSYLKKSSTVVVTVEGEKVAEFPLNEDCEYLICGKNGGTNLLIIKDGAAYIQEASCPDKVCVHMGNADEIKPISCMPNGVVVSIKEN